MRKSLQAPVAEGDGREARVIFERAQYGSLGGPGEPDSARGRQPSASRPKRTSG